MDRDYQRLERAVEADPLNRELLDHYGRVSRRMGWRCQGRLIEQFVGDLYLNEPGASYEQGANCSAFYKPSSLRNYAKLGGRIVLDIIRALGNDNAKVRWNAAAALSFMGSSAELAIPDLVNLLEDPDQSVQRVAAWALRVYSEKSVPILVNELNECVEKGPAICFALGFMGQKAKSALPLLHEAIDIDLFRGDTFLTRALKKIEGAELDIPQAIQGVQVDFDLEDCESQADLEWISFCSEIYGIENQLPRYTYGQTYFDPESQVFKDSVLNVSIITASCSSEARVYLRDGQGWQEHGILVQELGNGYRLYLRISSAEGSYLTQSELMYQVFQGFRKHCMGNRWTIFDRFERDHGYGPDEIPVYRFLRD